MVLKNFWTAQRQRNVLEETNRFRCILNNESMSETLVRLELKVGQLLVAEPMCRCPGRVKIYSSLARV